jgi:hypothetical protein
MEGLSDLGMGVWIDLRRDECQEVIPSGDYTGKGRGHVDDSFADGSPHLPTHDAPMLPASPLKQDIDKGDGEDRAQDQARQTRERMVQKTVMVNGEPNNRGHKTQCGQPN